MSDNTWTVIGASLVAGLLVAGAVTAVVEGRWPVAIFLAAVAAWFTWRARQGARGL